MKPIYFATAWPFIFVASLAFADPKTAYVEGSDTGINLRRTASTILLDVDQLAEALGWQAKIIRQGKLLVLCRTSDQSICVPIQLDDVQSLSSPKALFVDADVLQQALGFTIDEREGRLTIRPGNAPAANNADVPAYHAAWGKGKGFRVGQTLPDIPLYDMQGREVRFSRFLGKQYILYCWASW